MDPGKLLPILIVVLLIASATPVTLAGQVEEAPFPGPTLGPVASDGMEGPSNDVPIPDGRGGFIENRGQWPSAIRFVSTANGCEVAFQDDGVMYIVRDQAGGRAVKVAFAGADTTSPLGTETSPTVYNYFLGNDPHRWATGVRAFTSLVYQDVWPGVDVRYTHTARGLKYDVILDGDADPSMVRFDVRGASGVDVGDDGLAVLLPDGPVIRDVDLVAWYEGGEPVEASFRRTDGGYGFDVDKEPGRQMVIDPLVVVVSTFLGGTYEDKAGDMKMDAEGNVVVAGTTVSTDYPTTPGAFSGGSEGYDVVLTKLDRELSTVLWSTYIGGTGDDGVRAISLDDAGNMYVLGTTRSPDFPITDDALQKTIGGLYSDDIFVLELTSDGSRLGFSTFMGGIAGEEAGGIQVVNGKVYVSAMTESSDFPFGNVTGAYYNGAPLVMVLSGDGTRIERLMTWDAKRGVHPKAMYVTDAGIVTIGGMTGSVDLPVTEGAYMTEPNWAPRSFIIQCDPWTNTTIFCTYFATSYAYITELVLDDDGSIFLAGETMSGMLGLEITEGAYCNDTGDTRSLFVSKMSANGSRLLYSTLVGAEKYDFPGDLEVTEDGMAVFTGWLWEGRTYNTSDNAHDQASDGDFEGFVLALNENGTDAVYSSFIGGLLGDYVTALEITPEDTLMVAGYTESKGFPVTEGAYQEENAGDRDMFVSELACLYPPSAPLGLVAKGGEQNISLKWSPPRDLNGHPIQNYVVHRRTTEGELEELAVTGNVTSFVDEDVVHGVTYLYRVQAFNGNGISGLSGPATARAVTVPDPPTNLTGTVQYDHIRLTWRAPQFTGGLELTGYRLYRGVEGVDPEPFAEIDVHLGSYVDMDIEDRTIYTYQLSALTEYGESRSRPSVTLRTTGPPTQPLGLNFTYGDQFIGLTWEGPEDDYDLPIVRYHVYRQAGDGPFTLVGAIASPDMHLEDRSVDVGVTYRYYVRAENAKGQGEPSDTIEAMTMVRPEPPRNVSAVATEHFVRITWAPPRFDGASPVLNYKVYLVPAEDERVHLGSYYVDGVTEPRLLYLHGVDYDGMVREYFVTAVNAEGESDPSPVAQTLMFQVPSRPRSPSLEWGDGEMSLNWESPEADGGTPVTSFLVCRSVTGEDTFTEVAVVPASTLRFVDDSVSNGVDYTYWVIARNVAGESEPSRTVSGTPAGPPDPPGTVGVEGLNGSVRLTWEAPTWDGGRPVVGYSVYGISGEMQVQLLAELAADELTYEQTDLVNGRVYLYAVKAHTVAGDSELGEMVEGIPVGAPSAPLGLLAFWMDGHVYITWSAPQDDGGSPVLGYRLHREDWEKANWTEITTLELVMRDYEVEYNTTYNYTLYAYNAEGRSPSVRVTFTVPPEPEPGEDDEAPDLWPLIIAGVVLAVVVTAVALWRRPRREQAIPVEDVAKED